MRHESEDGMSDGDFYTERAPTWWDRLVDAIAARRSGQELPMDSLFQSTGAWAPQTVADVPEQLKAQIREEAVLEIFNRLESSLRLLLHATTEGREPAGPEQYQKILNVWRYELENRANLIPDTYCGAVVRYEPRMDEAYVIDGRCSPGDLLLIRVPCWRCFDRIVIRGEAEPAGDQAAAASEEPPASSPAGESDLKAAAGDSPEDGVEGAQGGQSNLTSEPRAGAQPEWVKTALTSRSMENPSPSGPANPPEQQEDGATDGMSDTILTGSSSD